MARETMAWHGRAWSPASFTTVTLRELFMASGPQAANGRRDGVQFDDISLSRPTSWGLVFACMAKARKSVSRASFAIQRIISR